MNLWEACLALAAMNALGFFGIAARFSIGKAALVMLAGLSTSLAVALALPLYVVYILDAAAIVRL